MVGAQWINGCFLLDLSYHFVFFFVAGRLESLPGKTASQKVEQNMSQWFQVIPSWLLPPQVGVYGHVSSSAGQGLFVSKWNVLLGFVVNVWLGHSKVNHINGLIVSAKQKVVRLDVPIDQPTLVNVLKPINLIKDNIRPIKSTSWMAMLQTVCTENLRLHLSNRSSKLGPSKSKTMQL